MGAACACLLAGFLSGEGAERRMAADCRLHLPAHWEGRVEGRFLSRPAPGRAVPFMIEGAGIAGCRGTVRALIPRTGPIPPTGARIQGEVSWEGRGFPRPELPEWSGSIRWGEGWIVTPDPSLQGRVLSLRGGVQERVVALWNEREAPLVEALILARREHLDPSIREAFATAGTAHLLAISGFHVGVIAGLLMGIARLAGLSPRRGRVASALGSWAYVLAIGAPAAAVRAALFLSLLALAHGRGRPGVAVGVLSTALLGLLLLRPEWGWSVGLQLSFAGVGGLLLLSAPIRRGWEGLSRQLRGGDAPRARDRDLTHTLLRGGTEGAVAGLAATLPTLPILAWHFDQISLVGIPTTLLVAPLVTMAIPGIGATLLLSLLPLELGGLLAGGTGLVLQAMAWVVTLAAGLPGSALWISRPALLWGGSAFLLALFLLRLHLGRGRVRSPIRTLVSLGVMACTLTLLPLLPQGRRSLELHLIDVGQGDALAIRTPGGRWVLVDAGPSSGTFDAGARRVLPYLRRAGAQDLDLLVLTHPHLDHIGGASALLEHLSVRGILDPSWPHPSSAYLRVLELAHEKGVSWWPGVEGRVMELDGVRIEVLHPDPATLSRRRIEDPNDLSIVLLVRWREVSFLLTGDAPAWVERRILPDLPQLSLLKAGHHGSRTSTSSELLRATAPQLAAIPVGDGNSFGHPHAVVLDRLEVAGVRALRTDRDGDVRIRFRGDGSHAITTRW